MIRDPKQRCFFTDRRTGEPDWLVGVILGVMIAVIFIGSL